MGTQKNLLKLMGKKTKQNFTLINFFVYLTQNLGSCGGSYKGMVRLGEVQSHMDLILR